MTSPTSRITELAKLIADKTAIVDQYFQTYGIPTPSFDINGPRHVSIPPEVRTVAIAHADVLAATRELHTLMLGPSASLVNMTVRSAPNANTFGKSPTFVVDHVLRL